MRLFALLTALLILTAARPAAAADVADTGLSVAMERVVVFKDGFCLFVKNCQGRTDGAGRAFIDGIPGAMVLGSFWAIPKSGRVTAITAKQEVSRRDGRDEIRKRLQIEFDKDSADKDVALTLYYYAPGIRWIPAYRVELAEDSGEADLAMQAELLNEAEDLNGIPVDLVVGVPNFRFKNSVSPMCLESSLRNGLGGAADTTNPGSNLSNALLSQTTLALPERPPEPAPVPGEAPRVPAIPPELSGKGSQDLYVYKIPVVSLKVGERAVLPIISAKIPFRHLYTWDVRLNRPGNETIPGLDASQSPLRLVKNEVWHLVELTNKTEHPWTTGAALVMDGGLPVCQELLGYTPVNGRCQVPVTIAVDIAGAYVETETGRVAGATTFDGHQYAKVSKNGTLRITNAKKRAVDLMVTFHFGGNATKASDDGKITIGDYAGDDWTNFRGNPALTGHSTVLWMLKLEPGEFKEVHCEYDYYTN